MTGDRKIPRRTEHRYSVESYAAAPGKNPAGLCPICLAMFALIVAACGTLEVGLESAPVSSGTAWAVYTDWTYGVSLHYPAHWQPVEGYWGRYAGPDGFFQLSAISGEEQTLNEVCRREAYHKLSPYGSQPKVENVRLRNLTACRILPSDDQPANMNGQAAMIFAYPQPVQVNEDLYHFLALWADKDHLQEIAQTVRFIAPEPLVLFSDPVLGIAFDIPSTWRVDSHPGAGAQFTLQTDGVTQGILTLSVLSEESTTLERALDEVRRGAWGPFIRTVQSTTLGEFPALRVEMMPEGDRPSVVWLIVSPSGRAVSLIPRADPALVEAVLATLRAVPTSRSSSGSALPSSSPRHLADRPISRGSTWLSFPEPVSGQGGKS